MHSFFFSYHQLSNTIKTVIKQQQQQKWKVYLNSFGNTYEFIFRLSDEFRKKLATFAICYEKFAGRKKKQNSEKKHF